MAAGSLRPVAAAFATFGIFAGAWAVAAVDVERAWDLSDTALGFLLGAGVLVATGIAAVAGVITDRLGARAVLVRSMALWGALIAAEALAPTLGVFAPVLVLAIGAGGALDVVMNIIAADALSEQPSRLVRFHALWNGAAVVGAAVTGIVLHAGTSWRAVWFAVAVLAAATALFAASREVPEPAKVGHPSMWRALVGLRHEGLVVLAAVFGASAMVEGGIATWGILYLRANLGVGVLAGVGAYVVGQSLATAARVGGGSIVDRLGSRRTVALAGTLAAAGLTAEALASVDLVAAAGLALASVGISVVWPLLIASVNNEARHPALAIGGVTACGYLGMMAGPPIVGIVAGLLGLRAGLLVLAGAAAFVAVTPAHVRTARAATA